MKITRLSQLLSLCLGLIGLSSCSQSNNLLLGRVETTVDNHTVIVTDCYRTSVPPPQKLNGGTYRFMPCRDADVLVRGDQLVVNGKSYGHIDPSDGVLVDHGVVSVQHGKMP